MAIAQAANAQTIQAPPITSAVDTNGVNLVNGSFNPTTVDLSIGQPSAGGLSFGRTFLGGLLYPGSTQWNSNFDGGVTFGDGSLTLSTGFSTENFTLSGSTYYSAQGTGDTATVSGSNYTMTARDGTLYLYQPVNGGFFLTKITHPNGEIDTLTYSTGSFTVDGTPHLLRRLQSVTNNWDIKSIFNTRRTTRWPRMAVTWRRGSRGTLSPA